jgi:hypothetical protein
VDNGPTEAVVARRMEATDGDGPCSLEMAHNGFLPPSCGGSQHQQKASYAWCTVRREAHTAGAGRKQTDSPKSSALTLTSLVPGYGSSHANRFAYGVCLLMERGSVYRSRASVVVFSRAPHSASNLQLTVDATPPQNTTRAQPGPSSCTLEGWH